MRSTCPRGLGARELGEQRVATALRVQIVESTQQSRAASPYGRERRPESTT
jgi:hypothetical protein